MFDYIIIGAGFAGSILAERLASQKNKKVLIIEKRNHIAGNAYDEYDENGILIHKYGPHIFHTRVKEVWDYLSQFTEWHLYFHHVLASIDGKKVPIPFNLNSIHQVFPNSLASRLEEKLISAFGYNVKIPILKLRETNDPDLQFLANYIYEKVFLGYTVKQWGLKPEELDASVTGRVPVYISRDNRYFQDPYQGLPKLGYTKMFENMLSHSNIKLMLNTDYKECLEVDFSAKKIKLFGQPYNGTVVFTGKIDEFFDYKYGELPYRSLQFEFQRLDQSSYQEVAQVNFPSEYGFTRITEFKKLTGQQHPYTTIAKEYPIAYDKNVKGRDIPYYPIIAKDHLEKFHQYQQEADHFEHVYFIGRLAEYRYYDMDGVVARALKMYKEHWG